MRPLIGVFALLTGAQRGKLFVAIHGRRRSRRGGRSSSPLDIPTVTCSGQKVLHPQPRERRA